MSQPVDLAARISALIEAYEHDQTQLAAAWRERYNQTADQPVAESTPPTRLSALRRGKPIGVRYFFSDPRRAAVLFDLLGVPDAERDALTDAARDLLDGKTPARLYIPLALSPGRRDPELWTRLRRFLEAERTPRPILLHVDDDTWDLVPRSLDEIGDLTIERADPETARERADEITDQGGLVATPRGDVAPFAQWVAVDYDADGDSLAAAPEDWRAQYSRNGRLDALPTPENRLDTLDFEPSTDEPPLPTGVELHGLMTGIARGDESWAPSHRLAWSRALEIPAGTTPAEVEAHRIRREDRALNAAAAEAGHAVERCTTDELTLLLDRARVRNLSAVRKVQADGGDHWHWINADPPADVAPERVTSHPIDAPEPALARLWAHVQGWTTADLAADPMLRAAVDALDPEGEEQTAFDLARAWILADERDDWPRPAPELAPADDAVASLRAVLHGARPAAEVRLCSAIGRLWTTARMRAEHEDERVGIYRDPLERNPKVRRDDTVQVLRPTRIDEFSTLDERRPVHAVPEGADANALDAWSDSLLALLTPRETMRRRWRDVEFLSRNFSHWESGWGRQRRREQPEDVKEALIRLTGRAQMTEEDPQWLHWVGVHRTRTPARRESTTVAVKPTLWTRAGHFTAQLARTLRMRLDAGDFAELPGSVVLLCLRPGVDARVELRVDATATSLAAIVELPVDAERDERRRRSVETTEIDWPASVRRGATDIDPNATWAELNRPIPLDLPEAVEFEGEGVIARVTFVPDLTAPAEADRHAERMLTELAAKFPR